MEKKSLIEPNGFIDPRALAEAENPTCAKCGKHRGPTILARQRHANQHANYGRARKPSIVLSILHTPTCTCAEPDFSYGEACAKELAQRERFRAEKRSGRGLTAFIARAIEEREITEPRARRIRELERDVMHAQACVDSAKPDEPCYRECWEAELAKAKAELAKAKETK